jgi:hypothetical protein
MAEYRGSIPQSPQRPQFEKWGRLFWTTVLTDYCRGRTNIVRVYSRLHTGSAPLKTEHCNHRPILPVDVLFYAGTPTGILTAETTASAGSPTLGPFRRSASHLHRPVPPRALQTNLGSQIAPLLYTRLPNASTKRLSNDHQLKRGPVRPTQQLEPFGARAAEQAPQGGPPGRVSRLAGKNSS